MEFVFDENFNHEESFRDKPQSSTYVTNRRRSVATNFEDVEFNPPIRTSRRSQPRVGYINTVALPKRWFKIKKLTWNKVAWIFAGSLLLRLIFMESGILDYQNMNHVMEEKAKVLVSLRQENADLLKEIKKIKTSSSYQKKMARDHLGVIAPDEYLIVFSR